MTEQPASNKKFRRLLPGILMAIVAVPVTVLLLSYLRKEGGKKTLENKISGYIVTFKTYRQGGAEMAFFKIAGMPHQIVSSTENVGALAATTHLYLVSVGALSSTEFTSKLKAVQGLDSSVVTEISKPIDKKDLANMRHAFAAFKWDATKVTDDTLRHFITSTLKGEYKWTLLPELKANPLAKNRLRIIRIEDHPEYEKIKKAELAAQSNRQIVKGSTSFSDTIYVEDVVFESTEEDLYEPPPPPHNLKKMTDAEIKKFILKHERRKISAGDIKVNRTDKQIIITLNFDTGEETITYKL